MRQDKNLVGDARFDNWSHSHLKYSFLLKEGVMNGRRLAVFLLSIIVFGLIAVTPAQADVTDDAVRAMSKDVVYVDSLTRKANPNVVATLKSKLTPDDNIIVVMVADETVDIESLAESLNRATNNSKIIAVAVGEKVYARSALIPQDLANDIMQRSKSITVTTVETLIRFVREVHDWQAKQPKPVKEVATNDQFPWPILIGAFAGLTLSGVAIWLKRRRENSLVSGFRARYAPERVAAKLDALQRKNALIGNKELNESVNQLCADSDMCFKRLKKDDLDYGLTEDALVRNLSGIEKLLDKYREINEDTRYIKDASTRKQTIVDTIQDFGAHVYEVASKNSRASISDMDVDVAILRMKNL